MEVQRVLVTHGSKYGSTAEMAEWVGDGLRAAGLLVDVVPARQVTFLDPYDAVVLGGALYAGRWHRDARRFARRFEADLRNRAVWLFSSGPLDASADLREIPPVPGVAKVLRATGARGHATFGGRLASDTRGIVARNLAKKFAGDYRNEAAVRAWAHDVARAVVETHAASASEAAP